jgi:hypothetical protein
MNPGSIFFDEEFAFRSIQDCAVLSADISTAQLKIVQACLL